MEEWTRFEKAQPEPGRECMVKRRGLYGPERMVLFVPQPGLRMQRWWGSREKPHHNPCARWDDLWRYADAPGKKGA